jgi:hypothetical protein
VQECKHDIFYRLKRIPAACLTMTEKTFRHGMNAGKMTGCGKYTRTKLNRDVWPYNAPARIFVPYCDNGFLAYEAWEKILQVVVHAEDDASNRSHTGANTRLETTRACKDLKVCGTSTSWVNSMLDLAKRASQRTAPCV